MNNRFMEVPLLGLMSVVLFSLYGVAVVSADESRFSTLEQRAADRSAQLDERQEMLESEREQLYCDRLLARGLEAACGGDESEVEEEEEEEIVEGCTDSGAINYNPEATEDDGSCEYDPEPVLGCTDDSAINYDLRPLRMMDPVRTQNHQHQRAGVW